VYTENYLEVYYYEDPNFIRLSKYGAPANQESLIFSEVDFKWNVNDVEKFRKYGNFTCRFTSLDGKKVIYTKANMVNYPLGSSDEILPTHIKCPSPLWNGAEQAKLDISCNGVDFLGDFAFTFSEVLDVYRIVPLAGPNEGLTKVKMYGSGFTGTKDEIYFKWGVIDTEKEVKEQVLEYIWNEQDFAAHAMVEGSEIL